LNKVSLGATVWHKKGSERGAARASVAANPPLAGAIGAGLPMASPPMDAVQVAAVAPAAAVVPGVEDLLRRLVGRLCIAARGVEPELDSELTAIQHAVRQGGDPAALELLLGRLTSAIAMIDARPPPADAKAASTAEPTAEPIAEPIAAPRPQPEGTVRSAFATMPEPVAGQVSDLSRLPRMALDQMPLSAADLLDYLAQRLEIQLDLPLDSGASDAQADPYQLADRLATAVNAQLLQLDDERQQLEKLLQQVTSQLNAIGSLINGEVIDRGAARQSRADLDARVRSEIRDLDQQITRLDDLSEVRRTAQTHISAIDDHLQVFEAREQTRDESAGERNEGMRERIQELERETTALQSALLREQKLALTDALTRIPNRLAYQERVKQDFQRWKRFRRPLVLLVWDIDHFKAINDTYGHPAGDKVLQLVAQLFKRQLRATDFVCRQGGEEFVMLLDGAADDMALQLANRMREAIGSMGFHCRGAPVAVTISCGLTSFQESDTPESVFQRADKLLYKAKHSGRNRCELG